MTVSRHRSRWVISLNVEAPDLHPARRHPQRDRAECCGFVGIDRGLSAWLVAALVKAHDRRRLEDLAIANLVRNRHLARPIADAAWGELFRQLSYKATWYGSQLTVAPRWFPSSKTCSNCGSVHRDLALEQRVLRCDTIHGGCGLILDRDLNAGVTGLPHRQPDRTPEKGAGDRPTGPFARL